MNKLTKLVDGYCQSAPQNVMVIARTRTLMAIKERDKEIRLIDIAKRPIDKEYQWAYNIFKKKRKINAIIINEDKHIKALAQAQQCIPPLLDDFCQIVGSSVKCVTSYQTADIIKKLTFRNACLIKDIGAIVMGRTLYEADTAMRVLEKTAKSYIEGCIIGDIKPICKIKALIMKCVYSSKYSKIEQTRKLEEMHQQ